MSTAAHDVEIATAVDTPHENDARDDAAVVVHGDAGEEGPADRTVGTAEHEERLRMFRGSQPKKRVVIDAPETDYEARSSSASANAPALTRDPRVVARVMAEQRRMRRRMADKVMLTLTGGYIPHQRGPVRNREEPAAGGSPDKNDGRPVTDEERFANRVHVEGDGERQRTEMRCPDRDAARVPPLREQEGGNGTRRQYTREQLLEINQFLRSPECALEVSLYPSVSLVSAGRGVVSLPVVRRAAARPDRGLGDFRGPGAENFGHDDPRRPAPPPLSETEREELQRLREELKRPIDEDALLREAAAVHSDSPVMRSGSRSPLSDDTTPRSASAGRTSAATMRVVAKTYVTERSTSVTRIAPQMMARRAASAVVERRPASDDPVFTVREGAPDAPADAPMHRDVYTGDTHAAPAVSRRSRSLADAAPRFLSPQERAASRRSQPSGYTTFSSSMYGSSAAPAARSRDDRLGSEWQPPAGKGPGHEVQQAVLASALGAGTALPNLTGSLAPSRSRSPVDPEGAMVPPSDRATPHRGNSPINDTPLQSASHTPGGTRLGPMNIGLPKGPRGFSIGPKTRESGEPTPTAWAKTPTPGVTPNMAHPREQQRPPWSIAEAGAERAVLGAAARAFALKNPEDPALCVVDDAASPTTVQRLTTWNDEIKQAAEGKELRRNLIQDMLGCEVPVWRGRYDISGLGYPPMPPEALWPLAAGAMPRASAQWEARVSWLETHVALMSAVNHLDRAASRQVLYTRLPDLPVSYPGDPETAMSRFAAEERTSTSPGPRYVFRDSKVPTDRRAFDRPTFEARAVAPPIDAVDVDGVTTYVSARRAPCTKAQGNRVLSYEFRVDDLNHAYRDAVQYSRKRFEYASRQYQHLLNSSRESVSRYSSRLAMELRRRVDRVPAAHPIVSDFVRLFPDRARENGIRAFPALDIEPRSNQAADFNAVVLSIRAQRRADAARSQPGGAPPSYSANLPPPPQYVPDAGQGGVQPPPVKPNRRSDAELRAELRVGLRTAEISRHQRSEKWQLIEQALAQTGRGVDTLPDALQPPKVPSKASQIEPQAVWEVKVHKWLDALRAVNASNVHTAIQQPPKPVDASPERAAAPESARKDPEPSARPTPPARRMN